MEETNCPVEGCTERIGGDRMELLRSNRSIKFSSEELINVCNAHMPILRHIGLLEADEDKIRKIRPKGTLSTSRGTYSLPWDI